MPKIHENFWEFTIFYNFTNTNIITQKNQKWNFKWWYLVWKAGNYRWTGIHSLQVIIKLITEGSDIQIMGKFSTISMRLNKNSKWAFKISHTYFDNEKASSSKWEKSLIFHQRSKLFYSNPQNMNLQNTKFVMKNSLLDTRKFCTFKRVTRTLKFRNFSVALLW